MQKLLILISFTLFSAYSFANDIYQQAVESSNRPAEDKTADPGRKPAKILQFFDLQPQHKVLDLFSGGGYYTELTANIVGQNGHVDAHNKNAYISYIGEEKLLKRYTDERLTNVTQLHQEANDLSLCAGCYDRVLMMLTFHDLFYTNPEQGWPKIDAPVLMEKIRLSLKTGGLVGIVDHKAKADAHIDSAQTLHRISAQAIKQYMQKWGFKLVAESDVLSNPEDKLTLAMWDKSIRGKTDRAVLLFSIE
jgi:predicted methyltransferase